MNSRRNGKNSSSWLKHIDFSVLDLLGLELAFLTAYYIYFGADYATSWYIYRNILFLLAGVDFVVDFLLHNHKDILRRGWYIEAVQTIKQVSSVMISVLIILFLTKQSATYSRIILTTTWGIAVVYTYIFRCILKYVLQKYHNTHKSLPYALIITTSDEADECVRRLNFRQFLDVEVRGLMLLDKNAKGQKFGDIEVVANKDDFLGYAMENVVDEVFVDVSSYDTELQKFIDSLVNMGITVHININQIYAGLPNKRVEEFNGFTVMTTGVNTMDVHQMMFKRLFDIIGGFVGSIITIVLCIIVGPIIFIMDPGPIFFVQERVGKNGRKFKMYKFRSMYMDAEERKKELLSQNEMEGNLMFKMTEDPRVIGSRYVVKDGKKIYKKGFGGFLRATSIDEMPQMFNVLKGDMSLVGTRPPTVEEVEQYDLHHKVRLSMRPGITGMWQVSGRSDITDFEEVVKLDREYIATWSLNLDAKILFRTIYVVLARKGSR